MPWYHVNGAPLHYSPRNAGYGWRFPWPPYGPNISEAAWPLAYQGELRRLLPRKREGAEAKALSRLRAVIWECNAPRIRKDLLARGEVGRQGKERRTATPDFSDMSIALACMWLCTGLCTGSGFSSVRWSRRGAVRNEALSVDVVLVHDEVV